MPDVFLDSERVLGEDWTVPQRTSCYRVTVVLKQVSDWVLRLRFYRQRFFEREPLKERNFWSGKSSGIGTNRGSCAVF